MPDIFNSVDPGNIIRAHLLHHHVEIDYDGGSNPTYVGWALPGASVTASVWRICKLTWDTNNNPVRIEWAANVTDTGGTNQYVFAWNLRTGYFYNDPGLDVSIAETVTAPANFDQPHATLVLTGRGTGGQPGLYVLFETLPGRLIRFNKPQTDLTDQTTLTWPSDGTHDSPLQMVYAPSKDRIYVQFGNSASLKIAEVHPDTLATADVITDGTKFIGQGSLATDNASLYIAAFSDQVIYKYNLTGFGLQATSAALGNSPHWVGYDTTSGKVFCTTASSPTTVTRLSTALAIESTVTAPTGYDSTTDDQALLSGKIYLALEGPLAASHSNEILPMTLATLVPTTGIVAAPKLLGTVCFGSFALDSYVYCTMANVFGSVPARLVRIDPTDSSLRTFIFPTGYSAVNECNTDSDGHLWVTVFENPGRIVRLNVNTA